MNIEPLNFVVERVFDLLKNEANILLIDEKKLLQSLQEELELIESYLKDIDEVQRKASLSNVLKTKINHLMNIVPEIEDFLDNLIRQKEQRAQRSQRSRVKAFFSRNSNPLIRKHHLVENVKQIRENLHDTLERHQGFELPSNFPQVTTRRRVPTNSCILKDEIIVGLDEDVDTLVAKFVDCAANSAIVGMGGSGKTTLAKKFYNHEGIKGVFPKRAWVCVSQEWNARDILLQICGMLGVWVSESEKMPHVKLQNFLEEEGSCLVVLDDVWEKHVLQELLPTLLSGNGRVLITTRKENIVKFPRIGRPFYIHRARRLTPEQSWELFSRIVYNCCDGVTNFEQNNDYMILGKEMLEKCDGLPLAIITLAGLLGTKGTIHQWENIKDCVISTIMRDDDEAIDKVLELSYLDLPYYIKPCFLYLGTFKEDADIFVEDVINLWIDEGFIKVDQCPESRRLPEVAMDILEELVQRCMLQVVSRDYADSLWVFRIHDLMRDLCINKAKDLSFFHVSSSSTTSAELKSSNHRAIINDRHTFVLDNPRLRSLICDDPPEEFLPFEKFKQLRVLSLVRVVLGGSAKHIGNMVLLRYLKLWWCEYTIENLDFIKKLRNLQTLIIKEFGYLPKLSDNIVGNMEHLRVFELYLPEENDVNTSFGVSNSKNLHILDAPGGPWMVKELPSISIHLSKLCLRCISSQAELDVVQGCVGNNLANLEALDLSISHQLGFDLDKMKLGRCQLLKQVCLNGKIIKQDGPLSFPPKLLLLKLKESEIEEEEDMKKAIARLDHLRVLYLCERSYMGDKLTIIGLPQLQKLSLDSLENIKECEIEDGALQQLQRLYFWHCKELERIPNGISNINTLQFLGVYGMPQTFYTRLLKRENGSSDGGEDFNLVQHIPTIEIKGRGLRSREEFY